MIGDGLMMASFEECNEEDTNYHCCASDHEDDHDTCNPSSTEKKDAKKQFVKVASKVSKALVDPEEIAERPCSPLHYRTRRATVSAMANQYTRVSLGVSLRNPSVSGASGVSNVPNVPNALKNMAVKTSADVSVNPDTSALALLQAYTSDSDEEMPDAQKQSSAQGDMPSFAGVVQEALAEGERQAQEEVEAFKKQKAKEEESQRAQTSGGASETLQSDTDAPMVTSSPVRSFDMYQDLCSAAARLRRTEFYKRMATDIKSSEPTAGFSNPLDQFSKSKERTRGIYSSDRAYSQGIGTETDPTAVTLHAVHTVRNFQNGVNLTMSGGQYGTQIKDYEHDDKLSDLMATPNSRLKEVKALITSSKTTEGVLFYPDVELLTKTQNKLDISADATNILDKYMFRQRFIVPPLGPSPSMIFGRIKQLMDICVALNNLRPEQLPVTKTETSKGIFTLHTFDDAPRMGNKLTAKAIMTRQLDSLQALIGKKLPSLDTKETYEQAMERVRWYDGIIQAAQKKEIQLPNIFNELPPGWLWYAHPTVKGKYEPIQLAEDYVEKANSLSFGNGQDGGLRIDKHFFGPTVHSVVNIQGDPENDKHPEKLLMNVSTALDAAKTLVSNGHGFLNVKSKQDAWRKFLGPAATFTDEELTRSTMDPGTKDALETAAKAIGAHVAATADLKSEMKEAESALLNQAVQRRMYLEARTEAVSAIHNITVRRKWKKISAPSTAESGEKSGEESGEESAADKPGTAKDLPSVRARRYEAMQRAIGLEPETSDKIASRKETLGKVILSLVNVQKAKEEWTAQCGDVLASSVQTNQVIAYSETLLANAVSTLRNLMDGDAAKAKKIKQYMWLEGDQELADQIKAKITEYYAALRLEEGKRNVTRTWTQVKTELLESLDKRKSTLAGLKETITKLKTMEKKEDANQSEVVTQLKDEAKKASMELQKTIKDAKASAKLQTMNAKMEAKEAEAKEKLQKRVRKLEETHVLALQKQIERAKKANLRDVERSISDVAGIQNWEARIRALETAKDQTKEEYLDELSRIGKEMDYALRQVKDSIKEGKVTAMDEAQKTKAEAVAIAAWEKEKVAIRIKIEKWREEHIKRMRTHSAQKVIMAGYEPDDLLTVEEALLAIGQVLDPTAFTSLCKRAIKDADVGPETSAVTLQQMQSAVLKKLQECKLYKTVQNGFKVDIVQEKEPDVLAQGAEFLQKKILGARVATSENLQKWGGYNPNVADRLGKLFVPEEADTAGFVSMGEVLQYIVEGWGPPAHDPDKLGRVAVWDLTPEEQSNYEFVLAAQNEAKKTIREHNEAFIAYLGQLKKQSLQNDVDKYNQKLTMYNQYLTKFKLWEAGVGEVPDPVEKPIHPLNPGNFDGSSISLMDLQFSKEQIEQTTLTVNLTNNEDFQKKYDEYMKNMNVLVSTNQQFSDQLRGILTRSMDDYPIVLESVAIHLKQRLIEHFFSSHDDAANSINEDPLQNAKMDEPRIFLGDLDDTARIAEADGGQEQEEEQFLDLVFRRMIEMPLEQVDTTPGLLSVEFLNSIRFQLEKGKSASSKFVDQVGTNAGTVIAKVREAIKDPTIPIHRSQIFGDIFKSIKNVANAFFVGYTVNGKQKPINILQAQRLLERAVGEGSAWMNDSLAADLTNWLRISYGYEEDDLHDEYDEDDDEDLDDPDYDPEKDERREMLDEKDQMSDMVDSFVVADETIEFSEEERRLFKQQLNTLSAGFSGQSASNASAFVQCDAMIESIKAEHDEYSKKKRKASASVGGQEGSMIPPPASKQSSRRIAFKAKGSNNSEAGPSSLSVLVDNDGKPTGDVNTLYRSLYARIASKWLRAAYGL